MKKFNLSLVAVLAMSTFAMAGGDIAPVEEPVVVVPEVVEDTSAFYIGAAYSVLGAEVDWDDAVDPSYDGTGEIDYDAFMLQVGYKYNKYIAIEGRYWGAVGDGDLTYTDIDGTITEDDIVGDIDATAWGIYVKPMYPVTEAFDIYALLGYANVDTEFGEDSWDDGAFSWGLGAAYSFTDSLSVFVDYVELYNDDITYVDGVEEWTVDTWNFGVTYTF